MGEPPPQWEIAHLVAALDAGIAPRLLAAHPAEGWCRSCHASAPCSMRLLAVAAQRARPGGGAAEGRW